LKIDKDHVFLPSKEIHLHINNNLMLRPGYTNRHAVIAATCNAISDIKPCYIKHESVKSQRNYEHGPQFTLPIYFYLISVIFYPLGFKSRLCYIVKKVSAEQNAGHVQLCDYFISQVMSCFINVVIDNGCLFLC
jgi:hypothetical protein